MTPELAPASLFGHERGAFTGATTRYRGVFEQANHGTLLLDEIGELPPPLQPILLRVLQDGLVTRIGSERSRATDVRLVAATNQSLTGLVAAGRFRSDLLYRVSANRILVPPLRDRAADIPELADHFLVRAGSSLPGSPRPALTPDAVDAMMEYPWPGNVRELIACVERLLVRADDPTAITRADVERDLFPERVGLHRAGAVQAGGETTLRQRLQALERRAVEDALRATGGNVRRAAVLLGERPSTLRSRIERLRLRAERTSPALRHRMGDLEGADLGLVPVDRGTASD
jgi:transcriptional regulator with GAF, ATPase, and Fis domain